VTGRGNYIDKTRNRQAPLPPPTTPLLTVRATRLRIRLHLGRKATRRRSLMQEGEGAGEGPIWRTREGGSEWELIKILLEGDGNCNKMNMASNTRLLLTTQVGQAHVATGVPLDLGTNTHTLPTRERSGTPNLESTDQHRSDR
jgi:hypothetical protein